MDVKINNFYFLYSGTFSWSVEKIICSTNVLRSNSTFDKHSEVKLQHKLANEELN